MDPLGTFNESTHNSTFSIRVLCSMFTDTSSMKTCLQISYMFDIIDL